MLETYFIVNEDENASVSLQFNYDTKTEDSRPYKYDVETSDGGPVRFYTSYYITTEQDNSKNEIDKIGNYYLYNQQFFEISNEASDDEIKYQQKGIDYLKELDLVRFTD